MDKPMLLKHAGLVSGRNTGLYQCPLCTNTFTAIISNVNGNRHRGHCGCKPKPVKEKPITDKTDAICIWDTDKYKHLGHTGSSKDHPLYYTWKGMRQRCTRVTHPKYMNYGGRGIKMCDRWMNSFPDFVLDMGNRPSPAYSIDRVNNDGDYEPANCRWATQLEQQHNKRPVKRL